ncbi:OmpA family protein [Thioalkalivibrio sp. ALR17-21]|uniref:OmpA family protein n=1 Tax=Thioalkalivibrio sp. ALR17-21 TaxID=1269813 RepID=UPI00041A0404|nr:OmpA family protein [Thioalkalivibrio sp. ALR17-21]
MNAAKNEEHAPGVRNTPGPALFLAAFLAAVGTPPVIADDAGYPDVETPLIELDEDFARVGRAVDRETLDSVSAGMEQGEVLEKLGTPDEFKRHRGEAHWFYNFDIPFATGDDVLVCQYRVSFDGWDRVDTGEWRRFLCERLYEGLTAPPEIPEMEILTLSADVVFGFDDDRLTPEGRDRIGGVAEEIDREYSDPRITLVGHADRIGDAEYNRELSQRRAESVREELIEQGIDPDVMVAEGRGETRPLVFCRGPEHATETRECLEPNRRVEIEIIDRGNQDQEG